jgi:hypothetical protein
MGHSRPFHKSFHKSFPATPHSARSQGIESKIERKSRKLENREKNGGNLKIPGKSESLGKSENIKYAAHRLRYAAHQSSPSIKVKNMPSITSINLT